MMILIGQFDSPFVRRVAIALRLYGLPFEHRPWSTFGDADKIAPYNPLRRVPTLVLDSGEALIESTAILDYLDELVGRDKAMMDKERAAVASPYWFGERIGHADIMVACALRFTGEAHPGLFDARYPALQAHAARCEALPPFKEIVQ